MRPTGHVATTMMIADSTQWPITSGFGNASHSVGRRMSESRNTSRNCSKMSAQSLRGSGGKVRAVQSEAVGSLASLGKRGSRVLQCEAVVWRAASPGESAARDRGVQRALKGLPDVVAGKRRGHTGGVRRMM